MDEIIRTDNDRHYIGSDPAVDAEMTFTLAGDAALIIDHTYVCDARRGEGLGLLLLDSVVGHAETLGRRVVPLCPFAKAQFDRYPEKYAFIAVRR